MAVKKELPSNWWLRRGLVCAGGARAVRRRHRGDFGKGSAKRVCREKGGGLSWGWLHVGGDDGVWSGDAQRILKEDAQGLLGDQEMLGVF